LLQDVNRTTMQAIQVYVDEVGGTWTFTACLGGTAGRGCSCSGVLQRMLVVRMHG
jgi:hypothetical protein